MHAAKSHLGSHLPKQIQRALPLYFLCIVIVIVFLATTDSFGSSLGVRRELVYRTAVNSDATLTRASQFPKKIWQTWKVDPLAFEERDLKCARTWTSKNPSYRYEVLTDGNDLSYVETHFGPAGLNRPDIVNTYRSLTAKIIKADLLRYLVMYAEGGLYADIDVEALRPVERFIPDRYDEKDLDMVIGIEIDEPGLSSHAILGMKSMSFCQWTFMCKPGLPVMMRLIENVIEWLNNASRMQKVPISEIVLDFDEVITGTGPSAFTSAVLREMSARNGQAVTWDSFHNMAESKLVGGILVLTVEAFAAGQGHSDSGDHHSRAALVRHHYHASAWPSHHPRYNHPVYGEVERCNWETDCVELWDVNKAVYEKLPPEEQSKLVELRKIADSNRARS